jgi:hypothetical protein
LHWVAQALLWTTRGATQTEQVVVEVQTSQPVKQGTQAPWGVMKFLRGQMQIPSEVRLNPTTQVLQVAALLQLEQKEGQAAQYLTPSVLTVKKVLVAQVQVPDALGLAATTHEVQLVALLHKAHPAPQGWQVLLASW